VTSDPNLGDEKLCVIIIYKENPRIINRVYIAFANLLKNLLFLISLPNIRTIIPESTIDSILNKIIEIVIKM
ncbi:hypothetical protein VJI72_08495, partial [Parvimonas micra]|uniref:hypothetical protein n=1 Tax=Parvimonas micra TaxID=33033 RepID=UPI002B48FD46